MEVKGQFSIDAIVAASILILGLILAILLFTQTRNASQIDFIPNDIISSASNARVSSSRNEYVLELLNNNYIAPDAMNISILELIGQLWVTNKTNEARLLIQNLSANWIPSGVAFGFYIDGQNVYQYGNLSSNYIITARRMISGIELGKPITGSTARAHLSSIGDKKTSAYTYFGGFDGQGNVTRFIRNLPSDANITAITLELDAGSRFNVRINNQQCLGTFNVTTGNFTADAYNLSSCKNLFVVNPSAWNNISIQFLDDLTYGYVGGGFVRVQYETAEFIEPEIFNVTKFYLTGVDGLINEYSSFYVPGTLENITVYLHYIARGINDSATPLYLTIGNTTVFIDSNTTTEQRILLPFNNFSMMPNLTSLSNATVPIRIGYINQSFSATKSGSADVILITDLSGSMDWEMDSNGVGTLRNCNDPNLNLTSSSRISVAKCLDREFGFNLTNASGTLVGLISYDTVTRASETVPLTNNFTRINATIGTAVPLTGYNPSGSTCICCGINSAVVELNKTLSTSVLLGNGTIWRYNTLNFSGFAPSADSSGRDWFDKNYNDSNWSSGGAILGGNYLSHWPIKTNMNFMFISQRMYPQLWELAADGATPRVEFDAGLNYTGNTFWANGSDDGWDSKCGIWGGNGNCGMNKDVYVNFDPNGDTNQVDNTVNADNQAWIGIGNLWDDGSDTIPSSGAIGLQINITSGMYAIIRANGSALLTFDYRLDRSSGLDFGEAGWIKAMFGNASFMNYLGSDLDGTNVPYDNTPEIFYCEDDSGPFRCVPDPYSGKFAIDLFDMINASGFYYVVLGGKAEEWNDSTWDENFRFYFDNVLLEVFNDTDHYYLRSNFTISNVLQTPRVILNTLADDKATVYINGQIVLDQQASTNGSYWDNRGLIVDADKLVVGTNSVAVELQNSLDQAKFDMKIIGLNDSRTKAIMEMTDGVANAQCAQQNTGSAISDAIKAACDAAEKYGIIVYAVGFSNESNEDTLQDIAQCGNGIYKKSNDIIELSEFYQDIANIILFTASSTQSVIISGGFATSSLYHDSYIELNYTSNILPPRFGEISLTLQSNQFANCNLQYNISPAIRVIDSKVTSYSSDLWTDHLLVNTVENFNLSVYNNNYSTLGDPFIVQSPNVGSGVNDIRLRTGYSGAAAGNCSSNNSLVYSGAITASIPYGGVLPYAAGCSWNIEYESGDSAIVNVPANYSGVKQCAFNSTLVYFDSNDSIDTAVFSLLKSLDIDDDNTTLINFNQLNIEIQSISIPRAPYLWGPAIVEVRMWQ